MKIEIEFDSSYRAAVCIDGKECTIKAVPFGGEYTLPEDVPQDAETTLGGMIMDALLNLVPGILQGWAAADEHQSPVGLWDELSDDAVVAASERIQRGG